ncbi:MAG TPA: sugar phosphate isomerase/epimerase family protein [Clostridiaceae bacterium]
MLKTSVSMWCLQKKFFNNEIAVKNFLNIASGWKVNAVELLDCFWKNETEIDETIKILKEKGIGVSAYSIANDFVLDDDSKLQEQIDYVNSQVVIAKRLNTNIMRVFSGYDKQQIPFEIGFSSIIKGFKGCIKTAEANGITLVLENHGLFAGKASQVKNIIELVGSENLKANVDTGNFLLVDEEPLEAVIYLKGKIGYVHFKDFKELKQPNGKETLTGLNSKLYQGTVIGSGDINLKEIVQELLEQDYEGYLSIEYEGVGDSVLETEQSIKYLNSII